MTTDSGRPREPRAWPSPPDPLLALLGDQGDCRRSFTAMEHPRTPESSAPLPRNCRAGRSSAPAVALTQTGDLRDVVAPLPGVQSLALVEWDQAELGVPVGATPQRLGDRREQRGPPPVQRGEQRQRQLDRAAARVRQLGPEGLVVTLTAGSSSVSASRNRMQAFTDCRAGDAPPAARSSLPRDTACPTGPVSAPARLSAEAGSSAIGRTSAAPWRRRHRRSETPTENQSSPAADRRLWAAFGERRG